MLELIAAIAALSGAPAYDLNEKHCLSKAVYHEARGEDVVGRLAVANVVLNRVDSSKYPNTICEVVYQNAQFSNLYPSTEVDTDSPFWSSSCDSAWVAISGTLADPTEGALFYHNPDLADPDHYQYAINEIVIQNHTFYNLDYSK